MKECALCPRRCRINRLAGETGFCGVGSRARVASWGAHWGEESVLVGERGSGAIFFSGCNLGCVFCQNWEISTRAKAGEPAESRELARIMLTLQDQGCANVNLVTPSHVAVQIAQALEQARTWGLRVPVVYNSSGYDSVDTLRLLHGMVDIYMPDFKFWSEHSSRRYLRAPDYPAVARAALKEMHRQVGDLVLDGHGYARRGLLVRHLLMPGLGGETERILAFIAREISPATYLNLMDQYRPCYRAEEFGAIDRAVEVHEVEQARITAHGLGLQRVEERNLDRLWALLLGRGG